MMKQTTGSEATTSGLANRIWRAVPVRIITGALISLAPVAVSMGIIHAAIDKPYRQVWPFLLATLLCLLAYRWFAQTLEKRVPVDMARAGAIGEFASGTAMGVALIGIVTLALWLCGVVHFDEGSGGWLSPMAEMLLAATLEEVIFRAVLFRLLSDWLGNRFAIVVSALLFAAAHLTADGVTLTAFIGLVLAGVMLAAAYQLRGRLWLPLGLHFGWNFTSAGIFGYTTSGTQAKGLLHTTLAGSDWLTGGAFGVEASVVTLFAIAVLSAILLTVHYRRNNCNV